MPNFADRLIQEYSEGKDELNNLLNNLNEADPLDCEDEKIINSMIEDMDFAIEWLGTGRQPGTYRGIDKRDAYRHKQYDAMETIPDITEQLEKEPLYMDRKQRRVLMQLFRNFSDRERQCFLMYEAEQLSMQQIADKLGISKGTVQTYIKRAKDKVEQIAS